MQRTVERKAVNGFVYRFFAKLIDFSSFMEGP
jgi:hypothetical protein